MKVLITGGSGFIGSHLADRLLTRECEVLALDNYQTGRRDNLSAQPRLTVIEGSVTDRDLVTRLFGDFRPDVVVHCAASYKDPDGWEEDARTNVAGTANVVQAAEQTRVRRLVYFQTALCYGLKPEQHPITTSHPLRPFESSYAISKTAAESYVRLSKLDWVSFRMANAYGPRNLSGPLPTFYHLLTTGKPCYVMDTRRDFVYIDDVIDCVMKAVAGTGRGVYHIASGADFAIKELFDATVAALGIQLDRDIEVRPRAEDDVYTMLLDAADTNRTFDWKTRTRLVDGVARAVAYYREFGITQTYTHLRHDHAE